SGSLVAS
ncbi:hypothetical protein D030_3953B, partial [Vibrio parahaemolyticus AQ3810]